MRVVDQLIGYLRDRGALGAEEIERLMAAGLLYGGRGRDESPAHDGRWTEREWQVFDPNEHRDDDGSSDEWSGAGEDETEEAIQASKSSHRAGASDRARAWQRHRGRRIRRILARAWRQRPSQSGPKHAA